MLHKFLYLDEASLDGYISALEDGLRVRTERTVGSTKGGEAGVDARLVRAKGSRGSNEQETSEVSDTAHARFRRLLALVTAAPEEAGWVELSHLGDLADVGYGALVSAECEIYVPDAVRILAGEGGAADALDMMSTLLPHAEALGLDTEGMPEAEEVRAMSSFLSKMSSDLVVVGEDEESNWKVAARLTAGNVRDAELEGYVRVIGKVAQRWSENRWKPLLALPGASLLPRKERKALESKKPTEDDGDAYLEGPAVMLDVLAIYR